MTQRKPDTLAVDHLLCAQTMHEQDFLAFLQGYQVPSDTTVLMLLEAQPRSIVAQDKRQGLLHFALFDAGCDFAHYTAGHIFHDQGELRWERQQSEIQLVYTGQKRHKPVWLNAHEFALDNVYSRERNYFLFGKRLDKTQVDRLSPVAQEGDFAEVRIPRLLRYPRLPALQEAQHIQLVMCEYVDVQTAQNVAYRYKGLVHFQKRQR